MAKKFITLTTGGPPLKAANRALSVPNDLPQSFNLPQVYDDVVARAADRCHDRAGLGIILSACFLKRPRWYLEPSPLLARATLPDRGSPSGQESLESWLQPTLPASVPVLLP